MTIAKLLERAITFACEIVPDVFVAEGVVVGLPKDEAPVVLFIGSDWTDATLRAEENAAEKSLLDRGIDRWLSVLDSSDGTFLCSAREEDGRASAILAFEYDEPVLTYLPLASSGR